MKIHEYQAKAIFKKNEIPVPEGAIAFTPEEALGIARGISGFPVVLKAQIHAGGRGKGGGVKPARSFGEVEKFAEELLDMTLVTKQTGPDGQQVRKILVEEGIAIEKELYLSMIQECSSASIAIVASSAGGMDIEKATSDGTTEIIKIEVNPLLGIQPDHCRQIATGLGLAPESSKDFSIILTSLYDIFVNHDCTLIEINPLALTPKGLIALDAKVEVDDNALFRQPEIRAFKDPEEEDPLENRAAEFNLNYIKLNGNVGNMVNGAGLAMATMDLIQRAGARPANFLDVGGGATAEMVENGFKIILSDKNVRAVLINIFGGILRCDVLARGVVQAALKTGINVPVIVRMEGTNVQEGQKILAESGLNLIIAGDLQDAACKITELVPVQK